MALLGSFRSLVLLNHMWLAKEQNQAMPRSRSSQCYSDDVSRQPAAPKHGWVIFQVKCLVNLQCAHVHTWDFDVMPWSSLSNALSMRCADLRAPAIKLMMSCGSSLSLSQWGRLLWQWQEEVGHTKKWEEKGFTAFILAQKGKRGRSLIHLLSAVRPVYRLW
jgi:hypothetical protein